MARRIGHQNSTYEETIMKLLGFDRMKALSMTVVAVATVCAAPASALPVTYAVNRTITSAFDSGNPLQSDSVVGTITTDGTIGVLHTANILSWDLNLIDHLNAANNYELTPSNSGIPVDSGSVLLANATGLYFDFSGSGEIGFQALNPGFYSGWRYYCLSTGVFGCYRGETITPSHVNIVGPPGDAVVDREPVGVQPLNNPPTNNVPEPATLWLFGLGLAIVGAGFFRRRRPLYT
jgi:PEP-CTERM motif